MTGRQRIDTSISGHSVAKVAFFLNGRRVMTKSRPPYSLELDFGNAPRTHILEAATLSSSTTMFVSLDTTLLQCLNIHYTHLIQQWGVASLTFS